jgi:hypothetical protein
VNNEIYCGTRGVATIYLENSEIIGNTINVLPTTAGNTNNYIHGIYITGHFGSLLINENKINILEKANVAGTYVMGIAFAGNGDGPTDIISVVNNMINVGAADETGNTYGIGLRSAQTMGNLKVYFNTILINNNASTLTSYGVGNHTNGTGPVDIDLQNNIIINNHSGNTGSSAIGLIPVTSVLTSDYNDLYSNQNLVNYQGTLYANLAAWQATLQDVNSVSKPVNFVSATDLHLTGLSNGDVDLAGIPIVGITMDIDGDTRSTTAPYMGSDEASIPIPVELVSFTASLTQGNVVLNWETATEINNRGFEIERSTKGEFTTVGFIPGAGTTTKKQTYTFTDKQVLVGSHSYRLKQIDFNGSYIYSNSIDVDVTSPLTFNLSQNYPNPFNPTTKINYSVPFDSKVTISVYSITGELVTELVNDFVSAGSYSVDFDGRDLASGMYIYKMAAGNFSQTNKMMLMK